MAPQYFYNIYLSIYSSPSLSVLFDLAQVCLQHDSVNDTTSDMGDSPAFWYTNGTLSIPINLSIDHSDSGKPNDTKNPCLGYIQNMVFPFTNQNGPKLTNLCEACQGVVAKMSIWPKLKLRVVRNNLFFLSGSNQVITQPE